MARGFRIYGACAGIVGLIALLAVLFHAGTSASILATVGLIHGVVFSAIGIWMDRIRRSLQRLLSAEELAQRMGLDPDGVRRLAAQKEIKPQINVNDNDLYDPDVFVDAVSLLRGSSAPVSADTLVRPALPVTTSSASETLLRATAPDVTSAVGQYSETEERNDLEPQNLLNR
jgi:hypothetical protein